MKRALLLMLSLSLLLRPIPSAPAEPWLPAPGPTGGSVAALALSPNYAVDRTVYAGLRSQGVYRTMDGGDSWHSVGPGDWVVLDLAISPDFATDQTLFVSAGLWTGGYSVYRSVDRGSSWEDVTPAWSALPDAPGLAISPYFATDRTVYVLGGLQTYLSTDGGDAFAELGGWFQARDAVDLAFSPAYASDETLFALVSNGDLSKSVDGGVNWELVSPAGLSGGLSAFAVSPDFAHDQTLIAVAAESGQLYTSAGGGGMWSPASLFLNAAGQHSLLFSPTFATDRVILAASSADPGAYRSEDGGTTWEPMGWYDPVKSYQGGFVGGRIFALALAPAPAWDAAAFAGTSSGIYRSRDRGVHWWPGNDGLARLTVRTLASAPGDPNTLLAGTSFFEHLRYDTTTPVESDGNLQLSTDGGQTWRDVSGRLAQVQSVAFSPGFAADQTAFATAGTLGQHGYHDGGIYRSVDGGQNWEQVLGDRACYALALHPNYPVTPTVWASAHPYSATATVGIYESADGGDTWLPLTPTVVPAQLIVPSPNYALDRTLFAGTHEGGLQRSLDGGLSWTQVLSDPVTALAVSPAYGASRTLYVAVKEDDPAVPGEVHRSTDGGDTWQQLTTGIPGTWAGDPRTISTLAFAYDGSVLVGIYYGNRRGGGAVYRSVDGGDTWQSMVDGLDAYNVLALASLPDRSLTLYAGTWASDGPRGGRAQALAVSPDFVTDGVAFAGEWTRGRYGGESGLGIFKSTDGGQTWMSSSGGTEGVPYGSAIHAFSFSPDFAADQVVFAGSWGGLLKSTDGGDRWSSVGGLYAGPPGSITSVAVAPDFSTSGHLLAASGWGGLYVSRDGGLDWTSYYTVSASSIVAYSPAFAVDGVAFAGGWGLYRTLDGGATWTQVMTSGVSALALSPQFGIDGTLFATDDALYISHDIGTSWISVTLPTTPTRINALSISPAFDVDQTLFAGVNDGLYRSTDGGLAWEEVVGYPDLAVRSLAISPGWPTHPVLLVGTDQGVYRTLDGGATWALMRGLAALYTEPLALSADGRLLLAGAYRHGLHGTADGGQSWTPLGLQEMGTQAIVDVAYSPAYAVDRTIYALLGSTVGIGTGVYRTTDGDTTWELVYSTDYLGAIAVSPRYVEDRTVYVAGAGGQVLGSDDGGDTWAAAGQWPTGTSYPARLVALPPNYPADGTLFAAGGEGFWRLPAGADTWQPAASGLSDTYVTSIAVSPQYSLDRTLLATASWQEGPGGELHDGVFASFDGGENWGLASTGLPHSALRHVAFSPNHVFDRIVYLTSKDGLYRSLDGGASWTAVGSPPGAPSLHDVIVDGQGDAYVSSDLGVWRYTTPAHDVAVNGGFEADSGWELPQTTWPAGYSDRVVYDGLRSLRVGIDNGSNTPSYSSARQVITVPTNALSATLGCHIYPFSGESLHVARDRAFPRGAVREATDLSPAGTGDAQYLMLLDPESDAILEVLFWELSNAQGWQLYRFDLTSYAGRAVKLYLGVYNDGSGGQTGMYVDNVSLVVAQPSPIGVASRQYLPLVLGNR